MKDFLIELKTQIKVVEAIAYKIDNGQAYMEELKAYLPKLNQIITEILKKISDHMIDINQNFVLQVLNDIIYGIEQDDAVILEDVLRYGLIEIYEYVGIELQSENHYE